MRVTLNGLIEALQKVRDAPITQGSGIKLGEQMIFMRVTDSKGIQWTREDVYITDYGSYVTVELKL